MKYIIIGRDDSNGNEYVRAEQPATAEEAVELCERLNKHGYNEHTSYRIETIQALSKLDLNALYAKLGGTGTNPLQQYKDTDSLQTPRTEDFTLTELFGNQLGVEQHGKLVKVCLECGGLIADHSTHVRWHNKLLP